MSAEARRYRLHQDKKGMAWDLLLYVPTVVILVFISVRLWLGPDKNWTYVTVAIASFLFIQSLMRIMKTRLMLLPQAPVALDIANQRIRVELRNGDSVELVSKLRYFPDFAGKTIAISGTDLNGKAHQYIFHLGQFKDMSAFKDLRGFLEVYR
ncbi:MAG TPA: hypothetical protein VKA13_04305 [Gammaproteobacteria bacterium]|nr:hypothetical protein [Gammaproteobacteria bacterium]